jgi:hypothetical protein
MTGCSCHGGRYSFDHRPEGVSTRLVLQGLVGVLVGMNALAPGCRSENDYSPTRVTHGNLKAMGGFAVELATKGVCVSDFKSVDDLLRRAAKEGVISEPEIDYRGYHRDAWGRPYRWQVVAEGAEITVRIVSDGNDGISQEGQGDDIYVEIMITRDGEPRMYMKPEK